MLNSFRTAKNAEHSYGPSETENLMKACQIGSVVLDDSRMLHCNQDLNILKTWSLPDRAASFLVLPRLKRRAPMSLHARPTDSPPLTLLWVQRELSWLGRP